MARMIPNDCGKDDFNGSLGEEKLYKMLEKLPEKYTIFHSVRWNDNGNKGRIRWGESDFTIFDPDRGLLVVEVKAGEISCQDGRIYQTNFKTKEKFLISPMNQATRCKHFFIKLLDGLPFEYYQYWVEAAVWFPSIKKENVKGTMPLEYHNENVLFEDDIANPQVAIDKVFNFYKMKKQYELTLLDPEVIINTLSPEFNAIATFATIHAEQERFFVRMTREQSYLLDYLEEQKVAAIQGGAGTGKTILAIEKSRRLSENENVLFLCFNRILLDYLKETFKEEMPNVDFYNLNSLACQVMRKEANEEDILKYLNDYDQYEGGWKYKSIIIDEGQDFAEEQIALLSDIAELNDGSFYVFYDKNQLVQQRNSLSWASEIECRLILSLNCRNTRSIAETATSPIEVPMIKMREDISGVKPNFYIVANVEDAKSHLKQLIRNYTNNGISQKQIVIITMKTQETSILAGIQSVGPYNLSSNRNNKGVLFTTAKKFKGMESDIVIIIDLDSDTFRTPEGRRIFYVGTSRAKHILDFVSILDSNSERVLVERLLNKEIKNPRPSIVGGLKVKIPRNLVEE